MMREQCSPENYMQACVSTNICATNRFPLTPHFGKRTSINVILINLVLGELREFGSYLLMW
jgi:hypothetical protein